MDDLLSLLDLLRLGAPDSTSLSFLGRALPDRAHPGWASAQWAPADRAHPGCASPHWSPLIALILVGLPLIGNLWRHFKLLFFICGVGGMIAIPLIEPIVPLMSEKAFVLMKDHISSCNFLPLDPIIGS